MGIKNFELLKIKVLVNESKNFVSVLVGLIEELFLLNLCFLVIGGRIVNMFNLYIIFY